MGFSINRVNISLTKMKHCLSKPRNKHNAVLHNKVKIKDLHEI